MAQSIITLPGSTFTIPLGSPGSPASVPSTTFNSPAPRSPAQLRRPSYVESAHAYSPDTSAILGADVEKQAELVEALKRSVTIVLWHKANTNPVRLREEIPTFPFFRLSDLTELASSLNLSTRAYVDVYNPQARTWEQEQLCAVHRVESGQRMLFRIRKSLIEGFEDAECPGLEAELRLQEDLTSPTPLLYQAFPPKNPRKRSADDMAVPVNKHLKSFSTHGMASFAFPNVNSHEATMSPPWTTNTLSDNDSASISTVPTIITPPSTVDSSPAFSPASSVHSLPNGTPQSTTEVYTPHTPVSPIRLPLPSVNLSPNSMRPGTISSESSLALAVTDPQAGPSQTLLSRSPRPPRPSQLSQSASQSSQRRASQTPVQTPTFTSAPLPPPPNSNPAPVLASSPSSASTPVLAPPTPPVSTSGGASDMKSKSWPHGKYVDEVLNGFREMDALMKSEPQLKQKDAFTRVFGVEYKKSTVCNHRKIYREAPPDLLQEYATVGGAGREERAFWSEFVRAVEGKDPKRVPGTAAAAGGAAGKAAFGQTVQSVQAFGSPQGGVLSLGPPMTLGMQGMGRRASVGAGAGVGGQMREEPMGSLRPPEGGQQQQQQQNQQFGRG